MSFWPLKIIVKLLLSWVPGRHVILRRIGIFRHGEMDNPAYAHKIFTLHAQRAFPDGLPENFTALELGPGDSVLTGLIARGYGAQKIWLCDAGEYATHDLALYKKAAETLRETYKINVPDISHVQSFEEMLSLCHIEYVTNGLAGLRGIPAQSVDFIWSHSVLEHVRKRDFEPTMNELARIVKKDGAISHNVDLQDHLDKALNNLRFPEKLWENDVFAGAGFYTNRIGYSEALEQMRKTGLNIVRSEAGRWERLPTPRQKLSPPFRNIPDEELRVRTYHVLLKAA